MMASLNLRMRHHRPVSILAATPSACFAAVLLPACRSGEGMTPPAHAGDNAALKSQLTEGDAII